MRKTVCVDLDGVLARYDGWQGVDHFGEPLPGAQGFVRALRRDFDVVIYTTRCNPEMNKPESAHLLRNRVRDWLDAHGFEYDDIYTGQGKPICVAFIDDRAVPCLPQESPQPALEYVRTIQRVRTLAGLTAPREDHP